MSDANRFDSAHGQRALLELVHEWRSAHKLTTTAGVKSALVRSTDGAFDEREWGYASFKEYVTALQEQGVIRLEVLPTNHWLILLPGESQDQVLKDRESSSTSSVSAPSSSPRSPVRLKPEVWFTTVTWMDDHRRLWDKEQRRGFVFPVDDSGAPAFESEPSRFVDMPYADLPTQREWMLSWASALPQPDASEVRASLAATAPTGEFRKTVERLGRLAEWRAELQRRVSDMIEAWAASSGVQMADLVDHRRPRRESGSSEPVRPVASGSAQAVSGSPELTLRDHLHRIIDRMSVQELGALQIPAAYLVDD